MKGYSTFPKATELEPYSQMQFYIIPRKLFRVGFLLLWKSSDGEVGGFIKQLSPRDSKFHVFLQVFRSTPSPRLGCNSVLIFRRDNAGLNSELSFFNCRAKIS